MVPSWFVEHKKARIEIGYNESFDEHDTKKRICHISLSCTLKIVGVEIYANYTSTWGEPRSVPTVDELPQLLCFYSIYCEEANEYYTAFFIDGHLYYSKQFQLGNLVLDLIDKTKIPGSSLFKRVF